MRWERDNGTVLSPNAFIPVYENNGKIIELDFYVFETVVEFIAENLKAGREQVPISINASSLHASDPQTINTYINILKKYSVDPTMVEIELTETAVVSEYESVRKLFDSFQLHGIKTAMDDFGSGYSSLNILKDVDLDVLKIDMKFFSKGNTAEKGAKIIEAVIRMAESLDMMVIAEGVEEKHQVDFLNDLGCDYIQGYYFGRPMSQDQYEKLTNHDEEEQHDMPQPESS